MAKSVVRDPRLQLRERPLGRLPSGLRRRSHREFAKFVEKFKDSLLRCSRRMSGE